MSCQFEAVGDQFRGQERIELVRPFEEVHVRVQAAGLLKLDLILPLRLQAISWSCGCGEETKGVVVRALYAHRLDHLVGSRVSQSEWPGGMPDLPRVQPVHHCPFMQPEAAQLRRPGRGRGEQADNELRGCAASGCEQFGTEGDSGRSSHVSGAVKESGRARSPQFHIETRLPAAQPSRAIRVISEQKVKYRMFLIAPPTLLMRLGPSAYPLVMCGLTGQPLVLR